MTIQNKIVAVLFAGLVLAFAAPAVADDVGGSLITAAEKEIIKRYFGARAGSTGGESAQGDATRTGVTGGLTGTSKGTGKDKDKGKGKSSAQGKGNKQMPRGITMKLQRGGTLPRGIEKTRMPADLARQLPRRPATQELRIVEDNVVLIEKTTGRILDLLERAVR